MSKDFFRPCYMMLSYRAILVNSLLHVGALPRMLTITAMFKLLKMGHREFTQQIYS